MHLLCGPVLSIFGRGRVGAMQVLVIGVQTFTKPDDLHLHEQSITLVQIILGQTNSHRQDGITLNAITLYPVGMLASLFMQDMLDWRRNGTRKGSNRQGETHLTYQHLEKEENGVDTPTSGERGCPLKILRTNKRACCDCNPAFPI